VRGEKSKDIFSNSKALLNTTAPISFAGITNKNPITSKKHTPHESPKHLKYMSGFFTMGGNKLQTCPSSATKKGGKHHSKSRSPI
jgi:hypothetical protein